MITAANFLTYAQENRLNASLFFYIHMVDSAGNNFYFTDAPTQLTTYVPSLVMVTPAYYEASLFDGIYSVRPVSVEISNIEFPQAGATTKRFSENFGSGEFETELCNIYLGYKGITSTGDLLPYYAGYMTGFSYGVGKISFNVVNQFIFELPAVPINKFTRASFAKISEDLLDTPIPFVYGRWNYMYSGTTHYGNKAFIPMFVTERNLEDSSPTIVLECADHEVDAINNVYIFDDVLNTIGDIQDTITNSLANARATIDLYTANDRDMLRAYHYLYGTRIVAVSGTQSDEENIVDGDFDTLGTIGTGGGAVYVGLNETDAFSRDEMRAIWSTTDGSETVAIAGARIEMSAYATGTLSAGSITISIGPSGAPWFSEGYTYTTANGWSDTDTFNVTTSDLILTHNFYWDGAVGAFTLNEDSGSPTSYGIVPQEGFYATMQELAEELDNKINSAGAANTYLVFYDKSINKIMIKRISGSLNFQAHRVNTWSDDIGYSSAAPAYVTDLFEPPDPTLLSVPDGDFGQCKIGIATSALAGGTLQVKGVRLRVTRSYRDYNTVGVNPRNFPGRRAPGRKRTGNNVTTYRTANRRGALGPLYRSISDPEVTESIRDKISGSKFFAAVDGYPTGATYFKKGPEIIKSMLEDYIGISSGVIDSTAFSAANTNAATELALYVADETDPVPIMADLARFSKGFIHIGQDGKYKCSVLKSSYSSGDVNQTVYYRDIRSPLMDNLTITRNSISEINNDLDFSYLYNWESNNFDETITRTTTSTLNINPGVMGCIYCTDDDQAVTIAEYFCGNGGTLGHFGALKTVVNITLLAAEYHLVELGDIVQFDTAFDSEIDAYGATLSGIYFMLVGKKYGRKEIQFTLLEVG